MTDILPFFAEHTNIFLLVIGFFALIVGSFLNVVIYRLPRMIERSWREECRVYLRLKPHHESEHLSLSLPASHCPECKHRIPPWHNIPLLSYLFLKGKCHFCHTPISIRYPLIEVITCLSSVYLAAQFGVSAATLAGLFFTWILICLTFIDIEFQILPDQLTGLLLWLGLFFSLSPVFVNSFDAILGGIFGYLIFAATQKIFEIVTGKIGMGQGDVKLLAAMGAFLGWKMLPLIILLASICGIIFAMTNMALKHNWKSTPLPFGPWLAVGGWIALLWGNELMQYYLAVM